MKETQDVARAGETVEALQQQLNDLESQFRSETQALEIRTDPMTEKLETIVLKPKKTDIAVSLVTLAWVPYWQDSGGRLTAAWK
jgi:hypothetical protein